MSAGQTVIQVFAKAPAPGLAKTRLIPALGPGGAARLARHMLEHALGVAGAARLGPVELWCSPDFGHPAWSGFLLPKGITLRAQGDGDLGSRMARAAEPRLHGEQRVLLMGGDCPALTPGHLVDVSAALDFHEAAILPTLDGGYSLLGLRRFHPALFRDMPWSTPTVADLTLSRTQAMQWLVWVGEHLPDIDDPADLIHLPGALRDVFAASEPEKASP